MQMRLQVLDLVLAHAIGLLAQRSLLVRVISKLKALWPCVLPCCRNSRAHVMPTRCQAVHRRQRNQAAAVEAPTTAVPAPATGHGSSHRLVRLGFPKGSLQNSTEDLFERAGEGQEAVTERGSCWPMGCCGGRRRRWSHGTLHNSATSSTRCGHRCWSQMCRGLQAWVGRSCPLISWFVACAHRRMRSVHSGCAFACPFAPYSRSRGPRVQAQDLRARLLPAHR